MKVLCAVFSPPTGSFGSLTRIMALAKECLRRGHEIAFCASGYVADMIVEKGFRVFRMPATTLFGLPKFLSRIIEKRSQNFQIPVREGKSIGNIWFVYNLSGMLKIKYFRQLLKMEIDIIKEENPDCIITEMDPASYVSAMVTGTPICTTFAKVCLYGHGSNAWKKTFKTVNTALGEYGIKRTIEPEELLLRENVLRIIPSIPQLDGTDENEANVLYTGNLLEPVRDADNDFKIDPDKRCIFAYMGTGSVSLSRIEKILPEAFSIYPGVECIVASQSIGREYSIGNARFVKYAPANKLLPKCDMVICHGGLNTVTQSIEAGVPLLLFPGPIFERRYNAEMAVKNNAGFMAEFSQFTVPWMRQQYEARANLARGIDLLKKQFLKYGGVADAVDRLENWVCARRR